MAPDGLALWDCLALAGRTTLQTARLACEAGADLILLGVNVFLSAIKDVVMSLRPRTTGEIQIVLDKPGPRVDPPLKIQVEYGPDASSLPDLKREIEGILRDKLIFAASVELLPPGALPRYEMKAKLIHKAYEQ